MGNDRYKGALHFLEACLFGKHFGGCARLIERTGCLAREHVQHVQVAI